eukprot:scaffold248800_cov23-Prasinocladus_malaysianus.AAC.2
MTKLLYRVCKMYHLSHSWKPVLNDHVHELINFSISNSAEHRSSEMDGEPVSHYDRLACVRKACH